MGDATRAIGRSKKRADVIDAAHVVNQHSQIGIGWGSKSGWGLISEGWGGYDRILPTVRTFLTQITAY
jgi:hypothetical protein